MGRRKGSPTVDYNRQDPITETLERATQSRLMRSPKLYVASIGFFGLLLVGAVYVLLVPASSTPGAGGTAAPATAPATSVPPVTAAPVATDCPSAEAQDVAPETLILTTFETQWQPTAGTLYPSSQSGGPVSATVPASCFTRTPEGALYSAASFNIAAGSAVTPTDRIAVVEARASRTGVYDQLMEELVKQPNIAGPSGTASQWHIVGYRWLAYSPSAAQVEFQLTRPDGKSVGMMQSVVWESNDWLVVVPPLNSQLYRTDLSRVVYTPWGPPA